jgi:hypothetical protein
MLSKDCPDDDFEASAARPPLLRAVGQEKGVEIVAEYWRFG